MSYSWIKEIKKWSWEKILGFDFIQVQGDMNVKKTNESNNIFGGASSDENIIGSFSYVGTNVKIGSRLESPEKRVFINFSLGQIIPLNIHYEINELKSGMLVQKKDSDKSPKIKYKPFHDGFNARMQIGFLF